MIEPGVFRVLCASPISQNSTITQRYLKAPSLIPRASTNRKDRGGQSHTCDLGWGWEKRSADVSPPPHRGKLP